ncbi:MAG TPA: tyrosine-protein phosphatase, partial [Gemmataceae bacterium]|nr:tyrosine-protein phosphatase [Gemmataceae bacterium]
MRQTPAESTDEQAKCQRKGRPLWRSALRGCAWGLVLAVLLETLHVQALGNFHELVPGRVYRCAQPSPACLERLIRGHGIRTVINLRGRSDPQDWYMDECRVTQRLDIEHEDIAFSAGRLPPAGEVRRLVEVLDHCEYPIVFHCQRGADRTGLCAAMVLLLESDSSLAAARWQLGLRYGHLALGRPGNLDWFLDLYADWLRDTGQVHSPAAFHRWCLEAYCPGPCRARLEWVTPPGVLPCRKPVGLRVRVHNTSHQVWHLCPDTFAGVHMTYTLHTEAGAY